MITIWKYPLKLQDEQDIDLEAVCIKPLTVQIQDDLLYLWALVDTGNAPFTSKVRVYIRGTGHPCKDEMVLNATYLNTVQLSSGLVWHIFVTPL